MKVSFDIHTSEDATAAATLLTQVAQALSLTLPAPAAAPAPAPAAAGMSQADFSAAVQNYAKAHGPKAAKAKMAEFGYGKTADVPAERYAEVAAHLAV